MKGFGKLLRALVITGLLCSVALVGAAQFLSIPANTPAMDAITKALEKVPPVLEVSRTLGDVLVFKERQSVALYIDEDGKPIPRVTPTAPKPSGTTSASGSPETTAATPPSTGTSSPLPSGGLSLARPSASGPNWGLITAREARSFTAAGKPRDRVLAGTAVAVLGQKKSSIGECLECSLFPVGPTQAKFVVLKKDVMMFGGTPADVPPDAQKLLVQKAKTLAALNQLELDSASAHRRKYPQYSEYQAVRADYLAYWKKVKALQKARDGNAGGGHVNAEDELRQLKGEDVRLGSAYKTAKAHYESWKKANPQAPASNNPRYQSLRAQADALDEKLSALPPAS